METIKNWFGIETPYRFEWNDVRCGITILNVVLIMLFGLQVSWFGLAIALFGVCKDLSQHRHINDVLMHLSSVVLNIYFLSLLYGWFQTILFILDVKHLKLKKEKGAFAP